jgi:ABC-type Zn uptake system ZnuABC Zn-binding protein ZnuA
MAPAISVVTTTSIMADWVENIGGDGVEVFSLVPTGADPHAFQPGAEDVAKIADADLVLSVGMGLEESWLKELLQNAARDPSTIIEMGEIVDPMEFAESHADEVDIIEALSHVVHEVEEGEISPEAALEEIKELLESSGEEDEDHGDEGEKEGDEAEEEDEDHGDEDELPAMALAIVKNVEDGRMDASDAIEAIEALTAEGEDEHAGHGHGIEDPHFWFDPLRVKLVVNDIAARLSALDPDRGDTYRANASAYNVRLDELHAWTKQQVSAVPEDRRLLVTSHDSLGYFANLYGFEVVGVVLSITTEVEPSAGDLIELVEEVTENGIPAVFGETTVSERLAAAVATESGAKLVRLYSGSLGLEDSGAETYIDMIRTNVERIVEVLR